MRIWHLKRETYVNGTFHEIKVHRYLLWFKLWLVMTYTYYLTSRVIGYTPATNTYDRDNFGQRPIYGWIRERERKNYQKIPQKH